jgi:hypothetical protein
MTAPVEEQDSLEPVDSLVIKSFSEKFNERYDGLLPEQRNLLSKYVLSFGANEADFKLCVMTELKRIKSEVARSLTLDEVKSDEDMVQSTNKVLERIEKFNVTNLGKEEVLRILKLQNLVSEYQKDAN